MATLRYGTAERDAHYSGTVTPDKCNGCLLGLAASHGRADIAWQSAPADVAAAIGTDADAIVPSARDAIARGTTFGMLIRTYADGVKSGAFDTDLDPVTREYVANLLHATAAPDGHLLAISYIYSSNDARAQDEISADVHRIARQSWPAVTLDREAQWHAAIVRAVEIIRGI